MKLEGKTLVIALIIAIISFIAMSIWAIKDDLQHNYTSDIAGCYTSQDQCGLHLIIEDSEYEDPTLDLVEGWLETNRQNLTEADREKGLAIVKHLKSLSYDERSELLSEAYDLYLRRNLP